MHANAVSISFPFYNDKAGSALGPLPATPSVAQLDTLITMAENADLAVTLRPVLSQTALGEARVHWTPAHLAAWFTAYQHFLLPYAALAQRDHVDVFVIGTELNKFSNAPEWATLRDCDSRGVSRTARVLQQLAGRKERHARSDGNDRRLRAGPPVRQRVGIRSGGRTCLLGARPAVRERPVRGRHSRAVRCVRPPVGGGIQDRADKAADPGELVQRTVPGGREDHLGGIYFWPLYFGQSLTVPDRADGPTAWAATPGATAIANCFTALRESL